MRRGSPFAICRPGPQLSRALGILFLSPGSPGFADSWQGMQERQLPGKRGARDSSNPALPRDCAINHIASAGWRQRRGGTVWNVQLFLPSATVRWTMLPRRRHRTIAAVEVCHEVFWQKSGAGQAEIHESSCAGTTDVWRHQVYFQVHVFIYCQ